MCDTDPKQESVDFGWLGGSTAPEGEALDPGQALTNVMAPALFGGMGQLNNLLALGNEVQSLPSSRIHHTIKEIGLHDAMPLVELCSQEQLREVLDIEVWQGDRVDAEMALDWAHALTLLSDKRVAWAHFRGLDIELIAHLLRTRCRIYLAENEEAPDESEGVFYKTPDGWFILDLLTETEAETEQLISVLEFHFEQDNEDARRLLQNVMWELPSDLEEAALRWRLARLQDLGFADPLEALVVYAYLDPATISLDEHTLDRPPLADPEPMAGDVQAMDTTTPETEFLRAALTGIDDNEERARLSVALMWLANRALSADRISPNDAELAAESLRALRCRLSLALEYVSEGDVQRASTALSRVALLRLARVGHSLAVDVARPLLKLSREGLLGRERRKMDLLPPELERRLKHLAASRPSFAESATPRPFASRNDLEVAASWVEEARLTAGLVPRNLWPDQIPDRVTLPDLFRTQVVNQHFGGSGPLSAQEAESLRSALQEQSVKVDLRAAATRLAAERLPDDPAAIALAESWMDELEHAFTAIHGPMDLRFVEGLWFAELEDAEPPSEPLTEP